MNELLTVEEMAEADRRTIEGGVPGYTLMLAAGRGVFEVIRQRWTPRNALVVCGPGNNGGDGYVIAKELAEHGWQVELASTVAREKLSGDALLAANDCSLNICETDQIDWQKPELIVDAIFGAGLTRPITDGMADLVEKMNACECPVIAVDMPSGVDGSTGAVGGAAVEALHTVTFFRAKPGHYLNPGKQNCGEIHIKDIGISDEVLSDINPQALLNTWAIWLGHLPWPVASSHKHARGSVFVCSGGPYESGATRLASVAALRCGAGLVTMLSPKEALQVNACHLNEVMLRQADSPDDLSEQLQDPRATAALIGPGAGVGADTAGKVEALLESKAKVVLDADAITSFEKAPQRLFQRLRVTDVLTPHSGEFRRLFGADLATQDRISAVRGAANRAGAVVLLKGDDTVVAAPDGRISINANGSPWLATAGSGDVLAGIITGLVAQGMPSFEAACASVWIHAECGRACGPGTIAGDLIVAIPGVLSRLGGCR